jgi:hypothetical protein
MATIPPSIVATEANLKKCPMLSYSTKNDSSKSLIAIDFKVLVLVGFSISIVPPLSLEMSSIVQFFPTGNQFSIIT